MDALLLSAGQGTRLRPLTLKMPKCLLPLFANDEPILRYWIDTLLGVGIDDIFINVFYLAEEFRNYKSSLPEDTRKKVTLFYEGRQRTIGELLYFLKDYMKENFLVINSDTYIERNDVLKFIDQAEVSKDSPICIAVEGLENVRGKSDVKVRDGWVIKFIEKPGREGPGYSWAGICMIDRAIFEKYCYEEISRKQLAEGIFQDFEMTAIKIGNVIDIGDSLNVYHEAREKFKEILK